MRRIDIRLCFAFGRVPLPQPPSRPPGPLPSPWAFVVMRFLSFFPLLLLLLLLLQQLHDAAAGCRLGLLLSCCSAAAAGCC